MAWALQACTSVSLAPISLDFLLKTTEGGGVTATSRGWGACRPLLEPHLSGRQAHTAPHPSPGVRPTPLASCMLKKDSSHVCLSQDPLHHSTGPFLPQRAPVILGFPLRLGANQTHAGPVGFRLTLCPPPAQVDPSSWLGPTPFILQLSQVWMAGDQG